uniref:Uncharacterized protein n=1 Tax=Parascaris equorum TaxID=6256 RepID=A0A914RLU0_PAREQ
MNLKYVRDVLSICASLLVMQSRAQLQEIADKWLDHDEDSFHSELYFSLYLSFNFLYSHILMSARAASNSEMLASGIVIWMTALRIVVFYTDSKSPISGF